MKMTGKIITLFLVLGIMLGISGCRVQNNSTIPQNEGDTEYKLDYETIEKDGTTYYRSGGKEYLFLQTVTGKSPNAKKESYYVILCNNQETTFENVDESFWGSDLNKDVDFVIVEYGLVE